MVAIGASMWILNQKAQNILARTVVCATCILKRNGIISTKSEPVFTQMLYLQDFLVQLLTKTMQLFQIWKKIMQIHAAVEVENKMEQQKEHKDEEQIIEADTQQGKKNGYRYKEFNLYQSTRHK